MNWSLLCVPSPTHIWSCVSALFALPTSTSVKGSSRQREREQLREKRVPLQCEGELVRSHLVVFHVCNANWRREFREVFSLLS